MIKKTRVNSRNVINIRREREPCVYFCCDAVNLRAPVFLSFYFLSLMFVERIIVCFLNNNNNIQADVVCCRDIKKVSMLPSPLYFVSISLAAFLFFSFCFHICCLFVVVVVILCQSQIDFDLNYTTTNI